MRKLDHYVDMDALAIGHQWYALAWPIRLQHLHIWCSSRMLKLIFRLVCFHIDLLDWSVFILVVLSCH